MKKQLEIVRIIPEDMLSIYANTVTVQHSDGDFFISFFELVPPMLIGSPEEVEKQLESTDSVKCRCAARVVINERHIPGIIKALNEILEKSSSQDEGNS